MAGAVPGRLVADDRAGKMTGLEPAKRIVGGWYPIEMGGVMRRQSRAVGGTEDVSPDRFVRCSGRRLLLGPGLTSGFEERLFVGHGDGE